MRLGSSWLGFAVGWLQFELENLRQPINNVGGQHPLSGQEPGQRVQIGPGAVRQFIKENLACMDCPPQGAAVRGFLRRVTKTLMLGGQVRQLPGNQCAILAQLVQLFGGEISR